MNKIISTTLTVIAILAVAGVIFFAGSMYARANAFGPSMMSGYGWNNGNFYGPSMMYGRGPGMMGGNGGMMRNGGNMMNGYRYNVTNLTALTVDQAKASAEIYLANLNNSDLQIAEIMIFDNNAYVVVKETGTGNGAFELLVDPTSQIAYPEHGPNMMWNLKYGALNHQTMVGNNNSMMSGMMGRNASMMSGWDNTTPADVSGEMTVTPKQAIEYAQNYLDANISGATAAIDPIQFYGYYTLDFERDGKAAGMLSVNGYSGEVFLHTWHGTFIEESTVQ
jgi:hypothetical protein